MTFKEFIIESVQKYADRENLQIGDMNFEKSIYFICNVQKCFDIYNFEYYNRSEEVYEFRVYLEKHYHTTPGIIFHNDIINYCIYRKLLTKEMLSNCLIYLSMLPMGETSMATIILREKILQILRKKEIT
jgi:hypothetical protein